MNLLLLSLSLWLCIRSRTFFSVGWTYISPSFPKTLQPFPAWREPQRSKLELSCLMLLFCCWKSYSYFVVMGQIIAHSKLKMHWFAKQEFWLLIFWSWSSVTFFEQLVLVKSIVNIMCIKNVLLLVAQLSKNTNHLVPKRSCMLSSHYMTRVQNVMYYRCGGGQKKTYFSNEKRSFLVEWYSFSRPNNQTKEAWLGENFQIKSFG